MSLLAARNSFCQPLGPDEKTMTDREVLEGALAAIRKRRGLLHGTLNDGRRVCAVGALVHALGQCNLSIDSVANRLQEYNDSMPKATNAVRRTRVLAWIKARLKELPA